MARPSNSELVRRAERTRSAIAQADPHATAALLKARRRILDKFSRDAVWWYEQAKKLVQEGTTRDDDPRVKLILATLRSFIPEQRMFPAPPGDETVRPAMTVNIVLPDGSELGRGTVAARQEAIEVRATRDLPTPPVVGETAMHGGG